jgi:hypothetical protein
MKETDESRMRQTSIHQQPQAPGEWKDESRGLLQKQPEDGRSEQTSGLESKDSRGSAQEVSFALMQLADAMRLEAIGAGTHTNTSSARKKFEDSLNRFVDTLINA